ncbi:hypothetical protein H9Q72_005656 [Fusarium xylarioides]|uniref:Alpha/beta hydrolase fold-3 domain-containing protein n=1 Tax=Fusarium xylarioides TaxID=221167 RepID=A0A9P7L6I1_9HYPO|nr:hypothetical protein H9Q70_004449 [Fusarium xylarioides]KAG5766289.1 hypothetical protein H9Q72_005656 [Fusarium xylarioides]KAG5780732.1 hypothetical protein H9Q73_005613 [Fusarium xylarioides]
MASDPVLPVDEYNKATFTYKVIEGQPILLDLLVPKSLPSGELPVLIRFHGGFLVYGSRDNLQLTPPRILEYVIENNTILVSCDYRLLPESTGLEILEDIEDVWSWVQSSLSEAMGTMTNGKSRADLGRVLVAGESAGGYLAIQLAFRHPTAFRAVIASYPTIDMRSDHFCKAYPKRMGLYPQLDYELVSQHLKQLPDGSTRAISNLPIAMVQHGTYTSFFGEHRNLFPIEQLEDNPQLALELPFIWLHHGFWSEINLIQSGEWEEGVKVLNTYLYN